MLMMNIMFASIYAFCARFGVGAAATTVAFVIATTIINTDDDELRFVSLIRPRFIIVCVVWWLCCARLNVFFRQFNFNIIENKSIVTSKQKSITFEGGNNQNSVIEESNTGKSTVKFSFGVEHKLKFQ